MSSQIVIVFPESVVIHYGIVSDKLDRIKNSDVNVLHCVDIKKMHSSNKDICGGGHTAIDAQISKCKRSSYRHTFALL